MNSKAWILFLAKSLQLNPSNSMGLELLPGFNSLEFEGIKNEAGRNSFFLLARKWSDRTGANLESLNSVLLRRGLPAPERLLRLNEIAITQMRTLLAAPNLKRLRG
jgi:hypothetical protein